MRRLVLCLLIVSFIAPAAFARYDYPAIFGSNRDPANQVPQQPFGTPGNYGGFYTPYGCMAVCKKSTCHHTGLFEMPPRAGSCYCSGEGWAICTNSLLPDANRFWGVIYADEDDVVHTAARIDSLVQEVGILVASPSLASDLEQSLIDLRDAILARSNPDYATALANHNEVLEQLPPEEVVAVYDAAYYGMFTDE